MLREILAAFGFEVDDSALKKGEESADKFSNTIKEMGHALLGGEMVRGFAELVSGSIESASQLNDLSERLGVSTRDLQFFQYAGRMSGVSAEEMGHSLGLLNRTLGEAAEGGQEQAKSFAQLGIKVRDAKGEVKTAADILPEVADKIQAMGSQAERTAAVTKLFGRAGAGLLPVLKDGSKGVEEARQKFQDLGLAIDEDFIQSADDAGDQFETLKIQFGVLKTNLVGAALPAVKEATEFLLKMGKAAQDLAKHTNIVQIVLAGLTALVAGAGVAAINGLLRSIGLLEGEMSILDAEVALPVAALLLLILVVEDIYTLFTGGDSVIGRFIDKMFGIGSSKRFIEDVKTTVEELWAQFQKILPPLEDVGRQLIAAFLLALPYIEKFVAGGLGAFVLWLRVAANGISQVIWALGLLVKLGVFAFNIVSGEVKLAAFILSGYFSAFSEYVIAPIEHLASLAGEVFGFVGSVATSAFDSVTSGVNSALAVIAGFADVVNTYVVAPLEYVASLAAKVFSAVSQVAGAAGGLAGIGGGGIGSAVSLAKSAFGGGGGDQNANVSQNNQTVIHVNGADQPQSVAAKVASAIGDTFESQKRNALNAIASVL